MASFLPALAGGSMIGLSTAVLLLFSGDILGFSGIVSSLALSPTKAVRDPTQHWKLVFLAAFLWTSYQYLAPQVDLEELNQSRRSSTGYVLGGLLVGFGTKLGNGCTSGHGLCGLGRMSPRSLASVMTFMVSAIGTSVLTANAPEFDFLRDPETAIVDNHTSWAETLCYVVMALAALTPLLHSSRDEAGFSKSGPAVVAGALSATGLLVSGMAYPSKVLAFLDVSAIPKGTWNPSLLMVMGGGVIVSFLAYQLIEGWNVLPGFKTLDKPILLRRGSKFGVPTNTNVDDLLLVGATTFGIGWGLAGLCPGPAIVAAGIGFPPVLLQWWPSFFVGASLANWLKTARENAA